MTDAAADCCNLDVDELRALLPSEPVLDETVVLLKGLADPTRLRLLSLLQDGEVCVQQLVEALGMSQSAVSHQLRTLRAARLVAFRKTGRHVHYRLADGHVADILAGLLSHSGEVA